MPSILDIIHGLTKVGVAGPDGTEFFNTPAEATKNYAAKESAAVQPTTDTHNEQIPTQAGVELPDALKQILGQSQTPDQPVATPGMDATTQQPADTSAMPSFLKPSFSQASTDRNGLPTAKSPMLTKKGALMSLILQGAQGAAIGSSQRNFGQGFQAAQEAPIQMAGQRQALQRGGLENQMLEAQIGNLPWQRAALIAGLQKSQAETGKYSADAAKSSAEAGAIPTKTALEAAQAEAANYKEDPNVGLIDIRTKQPVSQNGTAPLSAEEAAILGKSPGDKVPLKLKNTANEIMNRGIRTVQANGRSLLVDGKGNTIKDMGAATPLVLNNVQNAGATGTPGKPSAISQGLADGTIKWGDVVSARTPMSVKQALLSEVKGLNPNFNSGDFAVEQAVKTAASKSEVPTKIGDQKVAFNTMIDHAELLRKAAKAIDNGNIRSLSSLTNAIKTEFGVPDATDLSAIINAYNHEVTTVVAKGHMTDSEVSKGGATMPLNANFATIDRVLNSYKALAQSKMKNLNKQKSDALNAARPGGQKQTPSGASTANPHSDLGFVPANQ